MSDYGSYRYMGFWFQPDPVNIEQADTFGNNKFLEKYWSADTYTQMPSNSMPNLFENYFNFNFDFDSYQNSNCNNYFSYDEILSNFNNQLNNSSAQNTTKSNSAIGLSTGETTAQINYNDYFNSIFS